MTLYTEAEAAEKWCPLARFKFASTSDNPSCNREGGPDGGDNPWMLAGTRCIGSRCMAFRWFDGLSDDGTACVLKPTSHAKRSPLPQSSPLLERRGYCGAFGKVEP